MWWKFWQPKGEWVKQWRFGEKTYKSRLVIVKPLVATFVDADMPTYDPTSFRKEYGNFREVIWYDEFLTGEDLEHYKKYTAEL